jgi:ferredoxin--NADP+ reductase
VVTDDGGYGTAGLVVDPLGDLIFQGRDINTIYAIGPMPMMKAVSDLTEPYNIKTYVSLNPVMIDGTGMCGGCRVVVDGKTRFACVDGPEFDGHLVDFDTLMLRNRAYAEEEKISLNRYETSETVRFEGLV